MPKICKDGRIWGQNNKEAGEHLGVSLKRSKYVHVRKLTVEENRKRWKNYGIKTRFKKGSGGIGHPAYKHGRGYKPYLSVFNRHREIARARDNFKCQDCGLPQEELIHALHVHHIDENKFNNALDNLTSLCPRCHGLRHRKKRRGVSNNAFSRFV